MHFAGGITASHEFISLLNSNPNEALIYLLATSHRDYPQLKIEPSCIVSIVAQKFSFRISSPFSLNKHRNSNLTADSWPIPQ